MMTLLTVLIIMYVGVSYFFREMMFHTAACVYAKTPAHLSIAEMFIMAFFFPTTLVIGIVTIMFLSKRSILEVGSKPCRSVSQGVAQADCLPKTAWPPRLGEGMETANLAAEIDKKVFIQMSLYAVQNGMKKKEVIETALKEFLERHKSSFILLND